MIKSRYLSSVLMIVLALLLTAGLSQAQGQPENRPQAIKQTISLQDLPQAVRQALKDAAPTDNFVMAEKVSARDMVGYKVTMDGARGKHVIIVSENGKVLKADRKLDEPMAAENRVQGGKNDVDPASLPQAVRQAIAENAPNDNIENVEKVSARGQSGYKVMMDGAKGKHVIIVSETGKVLKADRKLDEPSGAVNRVQSGKAEVNAEDLPAPVRQALRDAAPGERIESAQKVNKEGRAGYLVVMSGARGKHMVVVSEDGKIVKDDMKTDEPGSQRIDDERKDNASPQHMDKVRRTENIQQKKAEPQDRKHK